MLHLRTLGGFEVWAADGRVVTTVVAQPKRAAVLLVLAAAGRGAIVRRDVLLPLFWPERDTESARAALRRALHFLRRELGEAVIANVGGEALRLEPDSIDVDLWRFEAAAKSGDHRTALDVAGELAPGLHISDAAEFNRWLDAKRGQVRRDTIRVATTAATSSLQRGDGTLAVMAAQRLTEIAPDEEASWRALIDAHRALGDLPASIATFNRYAAYLRAELDLEPSRDLEAMANAPIAARPRPTESAITPATAATTNAHIESPIAAVVARSRPRWRLGALVCTVAVSLSAMAWSAVRIARASTSDVNAPGVVAVLPFAVSGDADVQYLGDGIVDLLSLRLDAAGTARTIDSRAILSRYSGHAAVDAHDASRAVSELRSSLGATRVVVGAVTQVGDALELAARLLSTDGTVLAVATARAPREQDLPAAVDEIARGILAAMAGRRVELTASTTHSLDALKSFIAGERQFRAGHFDAAVVNYRAAIRADTTFGRAYARLSAALSEATNVQALDAMRMANAARRFADQLPAVERLLVLGHAEFYAGSAQASEQYFRAATSAAPDAVEAWLGLGESLFHGNPIDGHSIEPARAAFARALALDPSNPTAIEHLARLDAWSGLRDSLVRRTSQLSPEARSDVRGREIAAIVTFATGDSATKAKLIGEIASTSPRDSWRIAWTTAHYARAFSDAERLLAAVGRRIPSSRRRGLVTVARAHFLAAAGRIPTAYALLDSARADAPIEALCTRAQLLLVLDNSRIRAGERDAVVHELQAWDGTLADADAWFEEELADDGVSIRAYYLARLGAPLSNSQTRSTPMVAAVSAASRGDLETALRIARDPKTRQISMRRSLRFNRGLDRLLIGEWLLATGDHARAAEWLASVPEDRGYDVLLIARAQTLGMVAAAAPRRDASTNDGSP